MPTTNISRKPRRRYPCLTRVLADGIEMWLNSQSGPRQVFDVKALVKEIDPHLRHLTADALELLIAEGRTVVTTDEDLSFWVHKRTARGASAA